MVQGSANLATFAFLLFLCSFTLASTLYVTSGASGAVGCTKSEPCGTISEAVSEFGQETDVTIVLSGSFSGSENMNIILPSTTSVTLQSDDNNNPASITCSDSSSDIAFTASDTFSLSYITLQNCFKAIQSTGGDLKVENCQFDIMENSAISVLNLSSFEIHSCQFSNCESSSIYFDSQQAMKKFEIDSCNFINTGGVLISFNDMNNVDAKISDCLFQNSTTLTSVTLIQGNWLLSGLTVSSCSTGISYSSNASNSSLVLEDVIVSDCFMGVLVNSRSPVEISGCSFAVSSVGVTINGASSLLVHDVTSFTSSDTNMITPLHVEVEIPIIIEISSISFANDCSTSFFSVPDSSNSTITHCEFNNQVSLHITGGSWGINFNTFISDADIINVDPVLSFVGRGDSDMVVAHCDFSGASLQGNGGALSSVRAALAISDSSFTSCSATYGSAVYVSDFTAFSMASTTFDENSASADGTVAIDTSNSTSEVFLDSVSFTSNVANNGAAISCCGISAECNVTLVYSSMDTVVLMDNENNISGGVDITCENIVGDFYEAAEQPPVNLDDSISNWFLLVVGLAVLMVVGLLLFGIVVHVVLKKKLQAGNGDGEYFEVLE